MTRHRARRVAEAKEKRNWAVEQGEACANRPRVSFRLSQRKSSTSREIRNPQAWPVSRPRPGDSSFGELYSTPLRHE
eukprot:scaffold926_cov248-Pinguiococcus_pyrenoidosus.AAC.19